VTNLLLEDAQSQSEESRPQGVHPVLAVTVGTTHAELALIANSMMDGRKDQVPNVYVALDSIEYEDFRNRLVQAGWTVSQVEEAFPRSHYFKLSSTFSEGTDFDSDLNHEWKRVLFEPALRKLAKHPDAPGCAGTPALGRSRVEASAIELRDFFERHLQELCRIRTESLALQSGVLSFFYTTYRGGTGTGATARAAAILRSVMEAGEVHLRAILPCVYGDDQRAHANAYAAILENQYYHRSGGGVAMKTGQVLRAPFDSISLVFVSNGRLTLTPQDALMLAAAIHVSYLRAPSQGAILARRVDLTDTLPHDLNDLPTHLAVEAAMSIQVLPPCTQDYMALAWVCQDTDAARQRFERWCSKGLDMEREEQKVQRLVRTVIEDLNLRREHLLSRLDPEPIPQSAIRAFFEQATGMLAGMRSADIKVNMASLPNRIQEAFGRFEIGWRERAQEMARVLAREISDHVKSKIPADPHLALEVEARIGNWLLSIAQEARVEAEKRKKVRIQAGHSLASALIAVQEARSVMRVLTLGLINEDEVTRDAALKACEYAVTAANSRAQQQRHEFLVQALEDGISVVDVQGTVGTLPSVLTSMTTRRTERIGQVRKGYVDMLAEQNSRLTELAKRILKRSQIFQRTLLYDGTTPDKLSELVSGLRDRALLLPAIQALLGGQQDLDQTLRAVIPQLPLYSESCRTLSDILLADAKKRQLVVELLRSCQPFSPIDRHIEEQQELRHRRDRVQILELPGGKEGPLAELVLREGIVPSSNNIVESGGDEIRFYYVRQGLPYSAIQPLARYREKYEQYLANPNSVTPHTVANCHELPAIAPPQTNLRDYTAHQLWLAKAVLPSRLSPRPSGGFQFRFESHEHGFPITAEETFAEFNVMVRWLAKHSDIRKALAAELETYHNSTPEQYVKALVDAWRPASGDERTFLQREIYRLRIDPHKV
jgi:hypothetical protein